MVLDPKPFASPLTHFPHSFPIDLASFPTWINSYALPLAPSSIVHGLQLSLHRPSWQQTHPETASGFFPDASMVRLESLRPPGQPRRPSATTATSFGWRRTAAAAPYSIISLMMEASSGKCFPGGVLGSAHWWSILGWERSPTQAGDGALGRSLVMGMGLSWSPSPKLSMKGPMPPMLATLIGPCPHPFSPLGCPLQIILLKTSNIHN